jgi:hypothetical protein
MRSVPGSRCSAAASLTGSPSSAAPKASSHALAGAAHQASALKMLGGRELLEVGECGPLGHGERIEGLERAADSGTLARQSEHAPRRLEIVAFLEDPSSKRARLIRVAAGAELAKLVQSLEEQTRRLDGKLRHRRELVFGQTGKPVLYPLAGASLGPPRGRARSGTLGVPQSDHDPHARQLIEGGGGARQRLGFALEPGRTRSAGELRKSQRRLAELHRDARIVQAHGSRPLTLRSLRC